MREPLGSLLESGMLRSNSVSSKKKSRIREMPARIVQSQNTEGHVVPLTVSAVTSGPRYGLRMIANST